MADTGGFATAAIVSGKLVREFLRVYWMNKVDPVSFALPPGLSAGGQQITLSGTLDLLPPQPVFATRPDNLVSVNLALAGALTYAGPGIPLTTAVWMLRTVVEVGLTTLVANNQIVVGLDLSAANVPSVTLVTIDGPAVPDLVASAISSAEFRAALTLALRAVPPALLQISPATIPQALNFGGTSAPFVNPVAVPRDDCLIIAADLAGITAGNAAALIDFRGLPRPTSYLEVVDLEGNVNPYIKSSEPKTHVTAAIATTVDKNAFVTFVNKVASPTLPYASWTSEAELSNLKISFADYVPPFLGKEKRFGMIVKIDAKKYGFTTTATIKIGIRLRTYTNPLPPTPDDIWRIVVDDIDIDESIFQKVIFGAAVVVSFLMPVLTPLILVSTIAALDGILPSLLANVANAAESQVQGQINAAVSNALSPRRTLTLPGTTAPKWDFSLIGLTVSPLGLDAYAWCDVIQPTIGPLTFVGGAYDPPQYYGQSGKLKPVTVQLPSFAGAIDSNDPTYRVEWKVETILGKAKKQVAFASNRLFMPSSHTFSFDPTGPQYAPGTEFRISARVSRTLGTEVQEVYKQSVALSTSDALETTKAYVHWEHKVFFLGTDGNWWTRDRHSVLHRTDPARRCRNVVDAVKVTGGAFDYTDELPFPIEEADAKRRGVLCDFCFFGGPNSHTLKT